MFDKIRLLLLPLLLFSFCVKAQEFSEILYNVDNGLPSSTAYALHQDKNGNIWTANGGGICRFDGYEVACFNEQDGIPGRVVLKLFPQKNGTIWGTCFNQNLFYFNENFDGFHVFPFNDSLRANIPSNAQIVSVTVDNSGTVHIGGYGIPPSFQISPSGDVDLDDTDSGEINYLCLLNDHFFVSSSLTPLVKKSTYLEVEPTGRNVHLGDARLNDSTVVFMGNGGVTIITGNDLKSIKTARTPILLRKLNDSLFAVGYYKGGVRLYNNTGELVSHFMKDRSVSDLIIDRNGGYWFANLYNGLRYVPNIDIKFEVTNETITGLEKDREGNLLIGCINGKIFKRVNGQLNDFYLPEGRSSPALLFYVLENDSVQIASSGRLLNNEGEEIGRVPYRNVVPDYLTEKQDVFCFKTWPYNIQDSTFFQKVAPVKNIIQYKDDFYLATIENEVLKYDGDTISSFKYSALLPNNIVEIKIPFAEKTFYLSTSGEGLFIIREDGITNIRKKDGLCSDYLNKTYIENDSTVWVGTSKGISVISFQKDNQYNIQSTNYELGLISNDVMHIKVLDDTAWVGTKSGLCYFPKKTLMEKQSPELFFRLQHVFQDKDTLRNTTTLSHDQNDISFYLNAVSFDRNEGIVYHYRIKELDENWRTTKNREIVFQDLNPGSYTFEARVELEGYFPDDLVQFNFTISPPFWQTWWFYSLYVLASALIVFLFFKIRVLTYNKDVVRELMRHLLKRIKKEEHSFVVRANGEDIKILSETVLYVKSAGNYLELHTTKEKHLIRGKISTFIEETTDPLEYLRVHRSYVIRIDKVEKKGKSWVVINGEKIPAGESYLDKLKGIQF